MGCVVDQTVLNVGTVSAVLVAAAMWASGSDVFLSEHSPKAKQGRSLLKIFAANDLELQ